jgi:hypothetical protein
MIGKWFRCVCQNGFINEGEIFKIERPIGMWSEDDWFLSNQLIRSTDQLLSQNYVQLSDEEVLVYKMAV